MAEDYLGLPSKVPIESGHYLSSLVHRSNHHGMGEPGGDAVGTQHLVGVKEEPRSFLVLDRNRLNLARPTRQGLGCTGHIRWKAEGVGNAYIVAAPGVAVVAVGGVVVGGVVENGAGPEVDGAGVVVVHRNEVWVGLDDCTLEQPGDNVVLPAVRLSRPG